MTLSPSTCLAVALRLRNSALMGGSVEEFRTFHRAEYDKWVTFVREQGIKPQ